MLEFALQYAAHGWRVFPVHTTLAGACSCGKPCGDRAGKHPRIRKWQDDATTDRGLIERWWKRWPDANIGIATGGGLVVIDIDSPENAAILAEVWGDRPPIGKTLSATTGRGSHAYLTGDIGGSRTIGATKARKGLLIRGTGGYVVAPPSWHASGVRYAWVNQTLPALLIPNWFVEYLQTHGGTKETAVGAPPDIGLGSKPSYLQDITGGCLNDRAMPGDDDLEDRIREALELLDPAMPMDPWVKAGMAIHSANLGDIGFKLWRDWSMGCGEKFKEGEPETRWRSFKVKPGGIRIGTLFDMVNKGEWLRPIAPAAETILPSTPQAATASEPAPGINGHPLPPEMTGADHEVDLQGKRRLIELNQRFAVVNNVGSKCMVMSWTDSEAGEGVLTPTFQTFKSFQERFGAKYIKVGHGEDQEVKQLGAYWLKWSHRREYEGLTLAPGGPEKLANGMLNLWRGFAVAPCAGRWDRMKEHVYRIVASGDQAAAEYIFKFAAWSVQHPGERAEAALVLRGEEGTGKGTFAHAMRKLFGHHGLHVSDSKHLVGSFNAHLRHCLWLYADEAFWAGNKQGESVLKALITEPTIMIEQKGVDAVAWRNRFHVCMTANADWVVPAGPGARRYMVVDVADTRRRDRAYFGALHQETTNGGLAAMLHDLLAVRLGDWHPRDIVETEALRRQKELSLSPLWAWWESVLQDAILPFDPTAARHENEVTAQAVFNAVRDAVGLAREVNFTAIGRFLRRQGCIKIRSKTYNSWKIPPLVQARLKFETHVHGWIWREEHKTWLDLDAKPSN